MVEGGQDCFELQLDRVDKYVLAAIVSDQIAQNMALRVEQERIDAVAGCQITHVVGDHAIQPADAIAPSKLDFRAVLEIVDSAR